MADGVVGTLTHLNARDVSFVFVSQAPLETLQAFKRRMGWGIPWVSAADSDFNFDLGHARSEEDTRAAFAPMIESGLPPVLEYMTRSTGTDVVGYLTQGPGFTAFIREDGSIYQTYSTTARGLEFLMGYYPILDRAPLGRGESGSPQRWVRRHDEYDS